MGLIRPAHRQKVAALLDNPKRSRTASGGKILILLCNFCQNLSGKPLAAFGPARRQHLAPALRRLARAKAVAALALQPARLIGPFHGSVLKTGGIAARAAYSRVKQEAGR